MKHSHYKILSVLLALLSVQQCYSQDSRATNFNGDWRFFKGDGAGFEISSFDDRQWASVNLPHDWSIEEPFGEQWASATGYLPGGIGWYRKTFELAKDQRDKIVYIYFDGVYKNSEVWINNQYLGKRPNGTISFYYDVTKYLNRQGRNVIAVRADHHDFADSRWYTGSGIYRNVYALFVQPVHVGIWGVQFTTPSVSRVDANAVVKVTIQNATTERRRADVLVEILSGDNNLVSKSQTTVEIVQGEVQTSLNLNIKNPILWSVEKPFLYKLRTTVIVNGKVSDVKTEDVGFRFFSFDANKGFSLNGVGMKLKGVCIHDDAGVFGAAVPAGVWERRLKILKAMGCNAIRMSHNPHQDYLYNLCDKLGILVQDEAYDEWRIGKNKWIAGWNVGTPGKDGAHTYFEEWHTRDLTDMVLRNRNHPSIIMWSIGNEIDYPNDPYTHEVLNTGRNPQIYGKGFQPGYPEAKELGEIAKQLVEIVKKADATRPVTAALAGVVMSNETVYPESLDVVGYNYQEYRYADDHQKYPNRIIYGSENGKSYDAWKAVEDNEFISGQFLWTGIDFLGEARSWPNRSSSAGLIDMAGFPKPQYFYRKIMWTNDPVVHVTASRIIKDKPGRRGPELLESHWNWQSEDSLLVTCFSNTQEVELFINGSSVGKKSFQNSNKMFSWKVKFVAGELSAIGFNHHQKVAEHKIKTTTSGTRINMMVDHKSVSIHPDSVVHVEIDVLDKDNLIVKTEEQEVEVIVTGGKLLGIESGSVDSHERYQSNKRKTVNGKLVAYVRGVDENKIVIEANATGLQSGRVEIISVK